MKKNYILTIIFLFSIKLAISQQGNNLNFDGNNDLVDCGNHSSVDITGNTITLEALVKFESFPGAPQEGIIISKAQGDGGGNDNGYIIRGGGSGQINFTIGDGNWIALTTSNNVVQLNTWHHIAATYDGSSMKIYIDGTEVASSNPSSFGGISSSNKTLRLGNEFGHARYIDGTIDEVRVWNIARTQTEINNNKSNELTLPQTGLVAYYKFNQGTPNGNNSTVTTLIDETGNNNGSLINFSLTGTSSNWTGESTLSILNIESIEKFTLFPNPSSELIKVSGLKENENYRIYNVLGTEIKSGIVSNNEQIDIRNFTKGVYFLKFDNANTIKFIKR